MKKYIYCFILILFPHFIIAQKVGINKTNPAQALDVNGKVQIADDAAPATAGAIRYNTATTDYEGYNGTGWNSFTAKETGALPSNPVPIFGSGALVKGNEISLSLKRSDNNSLVSPVPAGKFIIITGFWIQTNGVLTAPPSGRTFGDIGPGTTLNTFPDASRFFRYSYDALTTLNYQSGGGAPLFVLKAGEYFNASNFDFSAYNVNIVVQGFLVDDLNY